VRADQQFQHSLPPVGQRNETEVQVWLAQLDQPPSVCDRLEQILSEDELLRARRFHFERDRQHFIVARGLLRSLLGCYLDLAPTALQFAYGHHGKPMLVHQPTDSALHFNLSHSHDLALYALAWGREVGVDIEYMRPLEDAEDIARHFFSLPEQAMLRELPAEEKQQGFYNCWTRKEAYIKAIGEGLSQPLDQFVVSLAPQEPARLLSVQDKPDETSRWSFQALQPPTGYAAALAVEGTGWQLSCWQMK
jgi:4'-phosphopantetheinyl transferase